VIKVEIQDLQFVSSLLFLNRNAAPNFLNIFELML
jgi:hypothetical protein